jgi:hypothetical protein
MHLVTKHAPPKACTGAKDGRAKNAKLSPAYCQRSTLLSRDFTPDEAAHTAVPKPAARHTAEELALLSCGDVSWLVTVLAL